MNAPLSREYYYAMIDHRITTVQYQIDQGEEKIRLIRSSISRSIDDAKPLLGVNFFHE